MIKSSIVTYEEIKPINSVRWRKLLSGAYQLSVYERVLVIAAVVRRCVVGGHSPAAYAAAPPRTAPGGCRTARGTLAERGSACHPRAEEGQVRKRFGCERVEEKFMLSLTVNRKT